MPKEDDLDQVFLKVKELVRDVQGNEAQNRITITITVKFKPLEVGVKVEF